MLPARRAARNIGSQVDTGAILLLLHPPARRMPGMQSWELDLVWLSQGPRERGNAHTHTYTPQPVVCGRICVSSLWLFAARPQVCGLPLPAARRARPASSCLASDGAWVFEAAVSRFDINDISNDEKGDCAVFLGSQISVGRLCDGACTHGLKVVSLQVFYKWRSRLQLSSFHALCAVRPPDDRCPHGW